MIVPQIPEIQSAHVNLYTLSKSFLPSVTGMGVAGWAEVIGSDQVQDLNVWWSTELQTETRIAILVAVALGYPLSALTQVLTERNFSELSQKQLTCWVGARTENTIAGEEALYLPRHYVDDRGAPDANFVMRICLEQSAKRSSRMNSKVDEFVCFRPLSDLSITNSIFFAMRNIRFRQLTTLTTLTTFDLGNSRSYVSAHRSHVICAALLHLDPIGHLRRAVRAGHFHVLQSGLSP